MKMSHLGTLPASVRLVSCIRLFAGVPRACLIQQLEGLMEIILRPAGHGRQSDRKGIAAGTLNGHLVRARRQLNESAAQVRARLRSLAGSLFARTDEQLSAAAPDL